MDNDMGNATSKQKKKEKSQLTVFTIIFILFKNLVHDLMIHFFLVES